MLTEFGKFLRKWRIDLELKFRVMASDLGVSMAYLSAVENGKKTPSRAFIGKLASYMKLSNAEREEMELLIDKARKVLKIDMGKLSEEQRLQAALFARELRRKGCEG